MQLTNNQKADLLAELNEKMNITLFDFELDKMLGVIHKHLPKSFSATATKQNEDEINETLPKDATDAGIKRASDNANEEWKKMALACVKTICQQNDHFTADAVYAEIGKHPEKTHNMSAMGAIMLQAKKNGWCEPTDDYQCSERKEAHRKPMIVWHSLIRAK